MKSYAHDQHFTLAEARRTLMEIMPELTRIVELKRTLERKGFDIHKHQYFGGMGPNGQKVFPSELEDLVETARAIDRRGVVIKSIELGLIDFPHLRSNGEEVYLCYRVGEAGIASWHTLHEGFAGRQSLDNL